MVLYGNATQDRSKINFNKKSRQKMKTVCAVGNLGDRMERLSLLEPGISNQKRNQLNMAQINILK